MMEASFNINLLSSAPPYLNAIPANTHAHTHILYLVKFYIKFHGSFFFSFSHYLQ